MALDQDRYRSLIERCAFRMDAFRGTIADLSPAQRAMAFVGAPTWGRINGWPCLKMNAAADGATSGALAAVLDVTGPFFVEAVARINLRSQYQDIAGQYGGGGGGWEWYFSNLNALVLLLYTAGGGVARNLSIPAASLPVRSPVHVLAYSTAGGVAGLAWVNGVPVGPVPAGAGVAANGGVRPYTVLGVGGGGSERADLLLHRAWTGTPSNADASCLAEASKLMIGGW